MPKLTIINYKPEIDCLRAIAVFLVILFHFELFMVTGGFIGVDIFFVISGFLITSLIIKDIINSKFSLTEFYTRRIRRIIPALYSVIFIVVILSYFILSYEHFNRLGNSSISAAAAYSNFFFWYEAGYFDFEKYFKPLLHTWSLSVELQFYLIWPILIFITFKLLKKKAIYFVILIFLLTLFLSSIFSERSTGYFYFTLLRLFEFSIGSLIFLMRDKIKIKFNDFFFLIGLTLIIVSSFGFSENSIFPGINALIPCIGAALILITGGKLIFFKKLFINNTLIFLGKISYSSYLIHWPLIVFYKYLKLEPVESIEKIILVLVTIVISFFSYKFIELPFRKKVNNSFLISTNKMLLIFTLTLFSIVLVSSYLVSTNKFLKLSLNKQEVIKRLKNEDKLISGIKEEAIKRIKKDNYFKDRNKPIKVLIWGDSHGGDLFGSLKNNTHFSQLDLEFLSYDLFYCFRDKNFKDRYVQFVKKFFKSQNKCEKKVNNFSLGYDILKNSDIIILSSRWTMNTNFIEIKKFLNNYTSSKVIVVGRKPSFFHIPTLYIKSKTDINYLAYANHNKIVEKINIEIKKKSKNNDFIFYDINKLICFDEKCNVMSENKLLINDEDHWSYQGFFFYSKVLKDNYFLDTIINNIK